VRKKREEFGRYVDELKEKGVPPEEHRRSIMEWKEEHEDEATSN